MIADKDRSYWIGASDTSFVIGNKETATFKKWYLEKLGLIENGFETKYTKAGTEFEHKILDTIPNIRKDYQILMPEIRLRVNYDGDLDGTIYEIKTHKAEKPYKVPIAHWRQCQVEMYAMKTDQLYILSYGLTDDEYNNYFAEIDAGRIKKHKVEYDPEFIEKYLLHLNYICKCLDEGRMPNNEQINIAA